MTETDKQTKEQIRALKHLIVIEKKNLIDYIRSDRTDTLYESYQQNIDLICNQITNYKTQLNNLKNPTL